MHHPYEDVTLHRGARGRRDVHLHSSGGSRCLHMNQQDYSDANFFMSYESATP